MGSSRRWSFAGYFLVVWDFIRYAVDHDIPVGPGRGSAAGSFVSYCMGITDIDPLRYDLLFERFLNPERITLPDIDIDFCMRGRAEVINYVTEKYGRDNVAQIITFGEMKARLAIRDVGRALGVPLDKVDKVAKQVPRTWRSRSSKALLRSPSLKAMYDSDPEVRERSWTWPSAWRASRATPPRTRPAWSSPPCPSRSTAPSTRGAAARRTSPPSSARRRSRTWACSRWTSWGSRPSPILADAARAHPRARAWSLPTSRHLPLDDPQDPGALRRRATRTACSSSNRAA